MEHITLNTAPPQQLLLHYKDEDANGAVPTTENINPINCESAETQPVCPRPLLADDLYEIYKLSSNGK